jgi:hypothetical protein
MLVIPSPFLRTPARLSRLAVVGAMNIAPCQFLSFRSLRRILLARPVARDIARSVSVRSLTAHTTARRVSGVC